MDRNEVKKNLYGAKTKKKYINETYPELKQHARNTHKKILAQSHMLFLEDRSEPLYWLDFVWFDGALDFNIPKVPTTINTGYLKSGSKKNE